MDMKLLKLLLEEIKNFPFLYNPKSIHRKNAKGKQEYEDTFTIIATRIIEKENKYFYISGNFSILLCLSFIFLIYNIKICLIDVVKTCS